MNNYFDTKNIADRYEKGRPYFHIDTILSIKNYLALTTKLDKALDVGCGTGLSTKALLEIAKHIHATDISTEMLRNAYKHENITYIKAKAEEQLFPPDSFDMITVSSGIHWFDIDRFLEEANRVLRPGKWLVIYDSFYNGEMLGAERFNEWYQVVYCKKFPPPPRNNNYIWSNEHLRDKNLLFVAEEQCKYKTSLTMNQFVLYLTTQSNITAQVEQGSTCYSEIEKWLYNELKPFFTTEKRTFIFEGWIKYLQKQSKESINFQEVNQTVK